MPRKKQRVLTRGRVVDVYMLLYLSSHLSVCSNTIIENASTLNLSLRLRGGGKVHGSLARAGKVKGQTPKVPKQEDSKKALTGRAKKRWQYNRRFVNVVAGMGGKKLGPNSNATKA